MNKVIGIDLGTTNSVVAFIEGGEAVVIPTAEGGNTCPSVVAYTKQGERLVGQPAKRQAIVNPENTVYSVKRLMGRHIDDPETKRTKQMVSYEIVAGPQDEARLHIPIKNQDFSPQEISAAILQKLKRDAEAYLGEPISKAVITVPAYFNDSQRQATKDAGQIAGLEVIRIVNEPTAAALAYGLDKKDQETILVFDLGGGTFDVSILEVGDGLVEVKSTNGDTHLGGDDWDERIVQWLNDEFKKEQGINLSEDRQAMQRLREAAEKAKIELSSMPQTEINLPFITANNSGPKHLQITLSAAKFEQLTEDLVDRCNHPVEQALKDSGLQAKDIDEVVLVGGSTRMPMILEFVQNLTGKAVNRSVNPDEVVALGAALQAGVITGDVSDVVLLDVTPLSLGLETAGSVMTVLIPRNTTIPTRKAEIFSTAEDNQSAVDIRVLQGERSMASDNKVLGTFRLDGIPAAPRGVPQIEVTFDIDANGILNVSAHDKASGKEQQITITASTNLTESDVENMVKEAKQHEADDKQRRELADVQNHASNLIYQAEKMLRELGDNMPPVDRGRIDSMIEDLKSVAEGNDIARIRSLSEQLQQAVNTLSQQLNQASAQTATGNDSRPTQPDDDVIEGEFEEV